ncbi:Transposase [Pseudomonas antarctica]|uniref:Transposase n=1 Tax=Pseudomonas antarctica TaxID=219572 RepID=A0A1H0CEF9_9PSED|nr:transposase [Pseudomonas antarctica]SDN56151.1 Transposase [Pseudomonas antarctica]
MQPTRRSYSKSFKAQVIQECAQPGASIASIALGHSLNANLVHKWIRMHAQKSMALQPAFIPLPMQFGGMRPAKSSTQPRKAGTWCALKFRWAPVLAF